ncbi:DUF4348 domain-containing protein [Muricauda sp. SCSIO 64092]|uniref:DUF4348 domain-containing protein n=1 Tax=Allomuricauda sp. SCSIO 64092 TaxID=2908842 RepID=UPI001FF17153|nr:DUF4348 domain-containing protein [Muricauda sp. SCSIO 64092]UOY06615.1 DUF4348 domain-containing protein [Muricauda sp. SCSIO 64092]
MIRIKLTVVVLIMLAAFSCKQEPRNKEASPNAIEPPNSYKKAEANEDIEIFTEMAKDCDQTFDDFFKRFARDSTFQKTRVKFPLRLSYYKDVLDDSLSIDVIKKSSYSYIDLRENNPMVGNDYEVSFEENGNQMDYYLTGIDNGILITYVFKQNENCWYLVEILDEST